MRRFTLFALVLAMVTLALVVVAGPSPTRTSGATAAPAEAGVKWCNDCTRPKQVEAGVKWCNDCTRRA